MGRHVAAMGGKNNLYRVCVKPAKERIRSGKLMRRWENTVLMVLKVTLFEDVYCFQPAS
jgi:hypothetical protein